MIGEYRSKQDALQAVGRPDTKGQKIVVFPDGSASPAYGRTPEAAVSTALHNAGYQESLERDGIEVSSPDVAGHLEVLDYNGRTHGVQVRTAGRSRTGGVRDLIQPGDEDIMVKNMDYPDSEPISLAHFLRTNADLNPEMLKHDAEQLRDMRPGDVEPLGHQEWKRVASQTRCVRCGSTPVYLDREEYRREEGIELAAKEWFGIEGRRWRTVREKVNRKDVDRILQYVNQTVKDSKGAFPEPIGDTSLGADRQEIVDMLRQYDLL